MTIDIYSMRLSPVCRAVLMTAKHLNIDLNVKNIDLGEGDQMKPEFIKLNPAHTIPVIDDNGFILWESRAIMQYLCNKYAPDSTLYPKDPRKRAIVDRWLNFEMSLESTQKRVLITKILIGVNASEDQLNAYKNNLNLADQLIGENKYLTGNELTIADLSLLPHIVFIDVFGFDLSDYPNFKRWILTLKSELPYYEDINHFDREEMMAQFDKMKARIQQKRNQ